MTTSERIARALKKRKLKPAHLAKKLGVSRSTVHEWLHGEEPRLARLREIADAIDGDLAELVG